MPIQLILLSLALALSVSLKSQSTDSLHQLSNRNFPVYYSPGHQQRAETIATRIGMALSYHQELLAFKPTVTLLMLSKADWKTYSSGGVVYGMPHYNEKNKRLIVAAEDNAFWKSFLPPMNALPATLANDIQNAYRVSDGSLSLQAFFDLLALHELGHAFHMQAGLTMQRKWMGELFSNILLHTYIAGAEPELLPALTLFPRMVIAGGTKEYKHTSLQDIHQRYDEIAIHYPKNYGWYQCRWHYAAAGIYDAGGTQAFLNLWNALKNRHEILDDVKLLSFLKKATHKSIADVVENWDRDMIK